MMAPVKMLVILIDETDMHNDLPLYESIVRQLMHHGIAGATVQAGIMGFGAHHRVHRKRLFGISDDRPVSILVVDEEARLRADHARIQAEAGPEQIVSARLLPRAEDAIPDAVPVEVAEEVPAEA